MFCIGCPCYIASNIWLTLKLLFQLLKRKKITHHMSEPSWYHNLLVHQVKALILVFFYPSHFQESYITFTSLCCVYLVQSPKEHCFIWSRLLKWKWWLFLHYSFIPCCFYVSLLYYWSSHHHGYEPRFKVFVNGLFGIWELTSVPFHDKRTDK